MAADTAIVTAADYADAMSVARRAKNWLFLLLLLMLLAELATFFAARFSNVIVSPATATTTQPAAAAAAPTATTAGDVLQYLVGLIDFLGIALVIVLALVLLVIINIMLVGRLVGVARLTSAFIWTLVLAVLLFPWQAFLADATFTSDAFKIPGVLYTWAELVHRAKAQPGDVFAAMLYWARFVGFPIVALIMLLAVQVKSNRGLRQAMGEAADDDMRPGDLAVSGTGEAV